MEAAANPSTTAPQTSASAATPAVHAPDTGAVQAVPAKVRKPINWSFIIRAGIVGGIILFFVGFALYETYVMVWRGGVVNKGDYYEVNLQSMGNFEMDQSRATLTDIPERYRNLDGKKVLLRGEVAPSGFSAGRGADFLLCYSVAKCCFGGPPKVQHFVACKIPKDSRQPPGWIFDGQIQVYGTLHVKVLRDGDAITSVYQLDVQEIRPAS